MYIWCQQAALETGAVNDVAVKVGIPVALERPVAILLDAELPIILANVAEHTAIVAFDIVPFLLESDALPSRRISRGSQSTRSKSKKRKRFQDGRHGVRRLVI